MERERRTTHGDVPGRVRLAAHWIKPHLLRSEDFHFLFSEHSNFNYGKCYVFRLKLYRKPVDCTAHAVPAPATVKVLRIKKSNGSIHYTHSACYVNERGSSVYFSLCQIWLLLLPPLGFVLPPFPALLDSLSSLGDTRSSARRRSPARALLTFKFSRRGA